MIRARYLSTTPFSHRREQATTKFAATYPCPTPYAAKVALIVGAIRAGLDPEAFTKQIRVLDLRPHPWGEGVVNTHLVKHWEPPRLDTVGELIPGYLSATVVFREFVYFDGGVDLYFPNDALDLLQPALPCVNCFGKQGSFFALQEVVEAEPPGNGVPLQGSDMKSNATWDKVSNLTGNTAKPREDKTFHVAMHMASGGANHLHLIFHG
jgi:hypothetical protein